MICFKFILLSEEITNIEKNGREWLKYSIEIELVLKLVRENTNPR